MMLDMWSVVDVVARCFGDEWKIIYTTGTVNQVGYDSVLWHNDGHISQWGEFIDIMPRLVTLWMLSDFTTLNGGTLVIPKSHEADTVPEDAWSEERRGRADQRDAVHVIGPAGSVFFFDSRVWHSTARNYTDMPRMAMTVRYAPSWITTAETVGRTAGQPGP